MRIKTLIICLLAVVLLCLTAGCAKDEPVPEVAQAEDYKILQRPGVDLSFDIKSPNGTYSTTAASIIIEDHGNMWVLPLTKAERGCLMGASSSGAPFDLLQQQFGEYKIEEGVITVDPFAP